MGGSLDYTIIDDEGVLVESRWAGLLDMLEGYLDDLEGWDDENE